MKIKITFLFTLFFLLSFSAFAQTDGVLAKFGTQTVSVQDLSGEAQQINERLPSAIAELRKQELDKEIAEMLLSAESAALKTTPEKLLDLKVRKLVQNPTDAKVQEVYEANRNVFGNALLAEVKTQIVNYLKQEQETQLSADFAKSLKAKYTVTMGVDVNAPTLKPTDVLVTVGTNKLLAERFSERFKPLEYQLRSEAYRQTKTALDEALYSQLILIHARRTGLPPEDVIRREISDKLTEPTDADAQKFYDANKSTLPPNTEFADVKTEILSYLSNERRDALESGFRQRLLKENNVQILLKQPALPVLKISADDDPSKGSANAPVTIVMFTDFQCPACARTHPAVVELLKTYGDKVRLVVRDYPLMDIHPNAFRAAEAANAAHAQGKFFEYIELLYQNQKAMDDASLKKYAAQVGLNAAQFAADLSGGKFTAEIRKDIKDGRFHGIRGTPSIYVNGILVTDLSPEGLKNAVENALMKK